MPIKKSELYSSLWQSCDQLRGGMDASQYKDYVLVLLFMKYVSDKAASQKGYLLDVPKGGSFADMVALKGDKEIGDRINKIIARLAEANDLKGVIDVADFNDADKLGKGKEMVDRLSNLVAIFDTPALDFRSNRAEGDDLLGDAYEYLMRHFATESGKSKGQFYTPAEVSRIMARVVGVGDAKSARQTIHDPTCGSGSLLLKAHDEARSRTGLDLALYGQEMDNATAALARMNMILHDCPTAEKVSAFDDLSLVQLIVERGAAAIEALPEGIRKSTDAVAETIENNVRRLIIDEQPINPRYYEKMSQLLDALIQQRRQAALDYQEYLRRIVELTRQVTSPGSAGAYPPALSTPGRRALYDNLDRDEELALAIDAAVRSSRQDDWRSNAFKVRRIRNAIRAMAESARAQGGVVEQPPAAYAAQPAESLDQFVERVLALVKNQGEY
jgi:hypothetical protein